MAFGWTNGRTEGGREEETIVVPLFYITTTAATLPSAQRGVLLLLLLFVRSFVARFSGGGVGAAASMYRSLAGGKRS